MSPRDADYPIFIQTALREWAYARPYASASERCQAIEPWLHHYNHHRPHAGIHGATPAARLNNLLGNDSLGRLDP